MTRNWTSEHSETEVLTPQDIVNGCLIVLNTPPNVLVSNFHSEVAHTILKI